MKNMNKEVLGILLFLSLLSLISATTLPEDCLDDEIQRSWESIFKESSSNIQTITNNTSPKDRCTEFFAYKANSEYLFYLKGEENQTQNTTFITAIKVNATQSFLNNITNFSTIKDVRTLNFSIEHHSNLRTTELESNELTEQFNGIFKTTPSSWIDTTLSPPITNETLYTYNIKDNDSKREISETGKITLEHNYHETTFLFTWHFQDENCTSNFTCTDWSECTNKNITRECYDLNDCEPNKTETASCSCTINWSCSDWSGCIGNQQIRTCVDVNNCGDDSEKPLESQTCGIICNPDWECGNWFPITCPKSEIQTRNCTDKNYCDTLQGRPEEAKSCSRSLSFAWIITIIVIIVIILILGTIGILRQRHMKNKKGFDSPSFMPKKPPKKFPPSSGNQGYYQIKKPLMPAQSPSQTSPPSKQNYI